MTADRHNPQVGQILLGRTVDRQTRCVICCYVLYNSGHTNPTKENIQTGSIYNPVTDMCRGENGGEGGGDKLSV